MTSDISFILKFIHQYDQSALEHSTPNGTLPNRLLSPIIENFPAENISSELSENSSRITSTNDQRINHDQLNETLLRKFQQYKNNFDRIQLYLNRLNEHFHVLYILIQHLRNNKNLNDSIEFFDIRLIQMRVKRDQINHLLNQSSLQKLIQQNTSHLLQSSLMIDYPDLLTSIQMSMNQKTILIDHINNDYRYRKYRMKEYLNKYHQQQDFILKLIKQIEEYLIQHEQFINNNNSISIFNQSNRQSLELIELSNEYEQLQHEYNHLTFQIKENLRKFSV